MIKIAQLKRVDAAALKEINTLVAQLSRSTPPLHLQDVERVIDNKSVELWVLRDEGEIIGMGVVVFVPLLTNMYAHVDEIVVHERYRGKGLGTQVMEKLIERARALKARGIDLTSRPDRVAANELYKKLGFELRETNTYRLKLT